MRRVLFAVTAASLSFQAQADVASADPAPRPVVTSTDELPRLSYRLPLLPSAAIDDAEAMRTLATAVDRASGDLLTHYDIRDQATVNGLIDARRLAALVRGDLRAAGRWTNQLRAADPSSVSAMAGDLLLAGISAADRGPARGRGARFRAAIRPMLRAVGARERSRVVEIRRSLALASSAYRIGEITTYADPQWRGDPNIDQAFAVALLRLWTEMNLRNPRADEMQAELAAWLARHPDVGADIWPDRDFDITAEPAAVPVTIAVWDSVDPSVFRGQIAPDPGDPANGRDDDGDGFVDESDGPAFNEHFAPTSGALLPVPADLQDQLDEYERYQRGTGDLAAGLETEASAFAQNWRRRLRPQDVEAFDRGHSFYINYMHGTHVAGVALRGLPQAVLVPVRNTFSSAAIPPLLDERAAERFATMAATAIRYMQSRGVRVANISWGYTALDVEYSLSRHQQETDPEARARRARVIFDTMFRGMSEAMAEAPGILFVIAAGNSRQDVDFVRDLPGSINLPNVLTVGAADRSGNLASFASAGESVDLFANGVDVMSVVPGGGTLRGSGASLSAPQVVNAAAKLLALAPDLTSAELAALLKNSARPFDGNTLPLLDARAARARARFLPDA